MKIDYVKLLKHSLTDFKENPILIIPLLISIGLISIVVLFMLLQFAAVGLIFFDSIKPNIVSLFSSVSIITTISLLAVFDAFLFILITAYIRSMYIGMYKDIIDDGKTNTKKMFAHGKRIFFLYLNIIFIKILLYVAPLLLAFLIVFGISTFSKSTAIFLGIILGIIYITYTIYLTFSMFFLNQIISVRERKHAFDIIVESFKYLKSNLSHVLATFFTIFIISLLFGAVSAILGTTSALAEVSIIFLVIFIITRVIIQIIGFLLGIFFEMFKFNSYFAFNPKH